MFILALKIVFVYLCTGIVYLVVRNLTQMILNGIGMGLVYIFKYSYIGLKRGFSYIREKFIKR